LAGRSPLLISVRFAGTELQKIKAHYFLVQIISKKNNIFKGYNSLYIKALVFIIKNH